MMHNGQKTSSERGIMALRQLPVPALQMIALTHQGRLPLRLRPWLTLGWLDFRRAVDT